MALSIPTVPVISFDSQNRAKAVIESLRSQGQAYGTLEPLSVRLAGVRGERQPFLADKRLIFVAGDYGHQDGGVDQTYAQVVGTLSPAHPIQRWAAAGGVQLEWADIGLGKALSNKETTSVQPLRVARVKDMTLGPALSLPEVQDAVWVGMNIASQAIATGMDCVIPIGIGTGGDLAAAAVTTVFRECDPKELLPETSHSGLSAGAARELILKSIALNQPDKYDPLDVLRCVGGADLCALVGIVLVAAAGQVPVVLDGFVPASAALAASYLSPAIRSYLFAGSRSYHPGLTYLFKTLGLNGLVDLGTGSQIGEGGILSIPMMEAALNLIDVEDKG